MCFAPRQALLQVRHDAGVDGDSPYLFFYVGDELWASDRKLQANGSLTSVSADGAVTRGNDSRRYLSDRYAHFIGTGQPIGLGLAVAWGNCGNAQGKGGGNSRTSGLLCSRRCPGRVPAHPAQAFPSGGSLSPSKAQAGGAAWYYQAPAQSQLSNSKQGLLCRMGCGVVLQPQVSQGWLLLGYPYPCTGLSHKGPYGALRASDMSEFYHEHSFLGQGEGGL